MEQRLHVRFPWMSSNRISPRRPRRVQVQFWKRGETKANQGYTTNISLTGMFLATHNPLPPGTRLRVEVIEADRGFIVEGIVVHARRIRGEMMRLSQPGMGVHFLSVEELVRELVPTAYDEGEFPGLSHPHSPDLEPEEPEAHSPVPEPAPHARPASSPSAPPIPTPREGGGTFAVHFLSPQEFLEVYRRDIVNGGLFVSTRYPGQLQETVNVELHPPFPQARPVLARARVVHRVEPTSVAFGANLLAGMGVELLDLAGLVEKLLPYIEGDQA